METARILIVEDDGDLSDMLDAYFGSQHYEVWTAAWGQDALQISQEQDLSLIMLDIHLPDMDGFEVCRQLRQNRRTQDVPIIFLTEKRERDDRLQGLELGGIDYITKPFDIQELRLRVHNAVQRARQPVSVNPITQLPDTPLLDQRLEALIRSDQPWTVLLLSMRGLDKLREQHGFVAADEALRAVTLMARSAVREYGNEGDFVGHFEAETLAILTTTQRVKDIHNRLERRIRLALPRFYQAGDRRQGDQADYLEIKTCLLDYSSGVYSRVSNLKANLSATLASSAKATHTPP
jgi:DNA-binding response OmpR family regulator